MADHADHLTNIYGVSIDAPAYELSDYHVYDKGNNFVFSFGFIPTNRQRDGQQIAFPKNLNLKVNFDIDSEVRFDNAQLNNVAGGRIVRPEKIKEDLTVDFRFIGSRLVPRVTGNPRFRPQQFQNSIRQLYHGTNAEVFQFGPGVRANRNFIVFSVDKRAFSSIDKDSTFLTWASSILANGQKYVDSKGTTQTVVDGPFKDSIGRALKDQNPEEIRTQNALPPSTHVAMGFGYPDVVIYDTSKPAKFPNGRALDDDIISYLSQFNYTTPPAYSPDNRYGIDFAADAEYTFTPLQGIYDNANRGDIRLSNNFPYLGEAYSIPSDSDRESIYRFYDKITGSYYYTSSASDRKRQQTKSWMRDEGFAFSAISGRGQAVYRFLNNKDKTHFWTASKEEYKRMYGDTNYRYEGETFFVTSPSSATPGPVAVHRLFNPTANRYFWTSSDSEISAFGSQGWLDQGIAWTTGSTSTSSTTTSSTTTAA